MYLLFACNFDLFVEEQIQFSGSGFVEFNKTFLDLSNSNQTVNLTVRTRSSDGIIFYQGDITGRIKTDYQCLCLRDGFVEYSFDLGGGPLLIRSTQKINDGYDHTLEITRFHKESTIRIDRNEDTVITGISKGPYKELNADSNLFLGGAPAVQLLASLGIDKNFTGCIWDIYFMEYGPLKVFKETLRKVNVSTCFVR